MALVVVPLTLAYAVIVYRRRARYPIAFTNLDVLAGVVETRRSWKRWVPLALLLLALTTAATAVAQAAGAHEHVRGERDGHPARRRLGLDARERREAVAPRRGGRRDADVPRPAAEEVQGRPGRVQLDGRGARRRRPTTTTRSSAGSAISRRRPAPRSATGIVTATRLVGELARGGRRAARARASSCRRRSCSSPTARRTAARSRRSRRRRPRRSTGIRVYGVALGTPKGKVTFGFGLYESTIPVPPDPVTVAKVSQITGGKSFTAKNCRPDPQGLQGPRLEHRPEDRAARDHLVVRGRDGRAARPGGRPLAALVGAASVAEQRAGGGAGTRPTPPPERLAQASPFACRNALAIDAADCLST